MLQRLQLSDFRNYRFEDFYPAAGLTFVVGENGSGKSSLLEAIYLLGTGRSFRTSKLASVVNADADITTLFAELSLDKASQRLGVTRNRQGVVDARVDSQKVSGLSQLARLMPVQVLHPGTVQLIEGGPGDRRRYLDWLMFHVEPSFSQYWPRLREAVTQRNRLLKSGRASPRELGVWDQQVAENSARIDQLRRSHLPALGEAFHALLSLFDDSLGKVSLGLYAGWAQDTRIEDALVQHRDQDIKRGATSSGAHRADLLIRSSRGSVREVFSRGQQKVVAYALVAAQIQLFNQLTGKRCLVLVDDLTSELDAENEARVLEAVLQTGNQVIVTTLDERIADPYKGTETLTAGPVSVFHVEHGHLRLAQ